MTEARPEATEREAPSGSAGARSGLGARGYEPPGIEWEEPIDVEANLASACLKLAGGPLCGAIGTS